MKYIGISVVYLLLLLSVSTAEAQVIRDLSTSVEDQHAILDWDTGLENGVRSFNIQRSLDGHRFHDVATVEPEGNFHHYSWIDNDMFKGQMNTYYYRIEVVMASGRSQYTKVVEVTLVSSGITRTWGSLKAIFR